MTNNINELIKQMNVEDEIQFADMFSRICNSGINESTRFNYTATDLVQVINNPEEFIIPEILPACKLLWEKGIETYMCGNYEDTDGRWIMLANVQEENQKIIEELMLNDSRYSFNHHYVLRVPFSKNEIQELCDLVEPLVHQDTIRYKTSTEFLDSYKKTGGELYNDEYRQIKRRYNPLYEKATLEEALLATGKINLYDAELDRVYDDKIFYEWHKNFVESQFGEIGGGQNGFRK